MRQRLDQVDIGADLLITDCFASGLNVAIGRPGRKQLGPEAWGVLQLGGLASEGLLDLLQVLALANSRFTRSDRLEHFELMFRVGAELEN